MNDFLNKMMETKWDLLSMDCSLEIFGNGYEFFIFKQFEIDELKDFFKSDKLDSLISEFQKIDDDKIKKNTSLFILINVENIQKVYKDYLNKILTIEEDEYYFRKYVIFYTKDGLSKLEPDTQCLIDYIQSEKFFDEFEKNMFFDESYFIAMQLIIKLPFISLPHSNDHFETVEDRIESRIKTEELIVLEREVNAILNMFNDDNIGEQLDDDMINCLGWIGGLSL